MRDRNSFCAPKGFLLLPSHYSPSSQLTSSIYLKWDSRCQEAQPPQLAQPPPRGKRGLYNLFSIVQTVEDSHVQAGELPGQNSEVFI